MRKEKLLILPALIFAIAICIYPLIYSLNVSFQRYKITTMTEGEYIGLGNYNKALFGRFSIFWNALKVTSIYSAVAVSLELFLGLGMALLLTSKKIRGVNIMTSILILPLAISPIIVGLMWRFMYNMEFGIINYSLSTLGLPTHAWLGDPSTALGACIIVDIWQWTPFVFLILLAAILALPRTPYESAEIDGASSWLVFKRITLPLLKPVILIILLFRIIDTFRIFDQIYALTWGGPGISTEVLSMHAYKTGFKYFHVGQAAAISWIFLVIMIVMGMILIKLMSRKE